MAQELFPEEVTFGVGEVVGRITKAVAAAFPAEVWVRGEIHGLKRPNASGHLYFDLCERNSRRGPTSTLSAAMWRQDRLRIERFLRDWPEFRLDDGLEVRVKGRVSYGYGRVTLSVSAVDPVHTLGRLAADRDRVLRALRDDGVLAVNGRLPVPVAPLHVGLVTSAGSAAYEDVLHELTASGYGFTVAVADTRVQGTGAEASVLRALTAMAQRRPDVVLLVRGGGARTDLATFDVERVARAVAAMPVPVFTGIGHEIDSSVCDEVAHTCFKTPTAAAAGVVELVAAARARTERAWADVVGRSRRTVEVAAARLDASARRVAPARLEARLVRLDDALVAAGRRLGRAADNGLAAAGARLDLAEARVAAADPARALARGWSLTRTADGRLVRRAADLAPGDALVTTFAEGSATSTVDGVAP